MDRSPLAVATALVMAAALSGGSVACSDDANPTATADTGGNVCDRLTLASDGSLIISMGCTSVVQPISNI